MPSERARWSVLSVGWTDGDQGCECQLLKRTLHLASWLPSPVPLSAIVIPFEFPEPVLAQPPAQLGQPWRALAVTQEGLFQEAGPQSPGWGGD